MVFKAYSAVKKCLGSKRLADVKREPFKFYGHLFLVLSLNLSIVSFSYAQDQKTIAVGARPEQRQNAVGAQELQRAIEQGLQKVPEFIFIKQLAKQMGVKVYLFGGTASGFAHYVRWDLLRLHGDNRYQPDRFDYDFTSIYRSNQDLDIVVDGPSENIAEMQSILHSTFPHFQGMKDAWEVRSLRDNLGGTHDGLLDNPDYVNQNNDSNSTGLIEITDSSRRVRDLLHWNSESSQFLQDLSTGSITYYDSPLHENTARFRQGKNPKILSAVRFLIKAVQYELTVKPEDMQKIRQIIHDFNPDSEKDFYVVTKLEEIGKKLIQNAVNIEYAANLVTQLGLKDKLVRISDARRVDSMGWWLSKEPLHSKPVGQGNGKTAAEYGLSIVAHETNNFTAYESITRAHTGEANVFISRGNYPGENAAEGDGFYTAPGEKGARGTGMTIRFRVKPEARENTDFTKHGMHFVFINKNAFEVIPESLNYSLNQFLEIASTLQFSDSGLIEKLRHRLDNKMGLMTAEEEAQTVQLIKKLLSGDKPFSSRAVQEWFKLKISARHPDLAEGLVSTGKYDRDIVMHVLSQKVWSHREDWAQEILNRGQADSEISRYILARPFWKLHPEWAQAIINRNGGYFLAMFALSQPHWFKHPELVMSIIQKGRQMHMLVEHVFSQFWTTSHPEWVQAVVDSGRDDADLAEFVLSKSYWGNHPEWVQTVLDRGHADSEIARFVLTQLHSQEHPEWVRQLIEQGDVDLQLITQVLNLPHWRNHPEFVQSILSRGDKYIDNLAASIYLSKPEWQNHPEWVLEITNRGNADETLAREVLSQPQWQNNPELVVKFIQRGGADELIQKYILSQDFWRNNAALRNLSSQREMTPADIREGLVQAGGMPPIKPRAAPAKAVRCEAVFFVG